MTKKTVALAAVGSAILGPLVATAGTGAAEAQPAPTHTTASSTSCATTAGAGTPTHMAVSAVGDLTGGGHSYSYNLGAQQLRFAVPAAGFDPLRATPAQLAAYGLPPRPAGGSALVSWTKLMSHLGHLVVPDITTSRALPNNLPVAAKTSSAGKAGVSTGSTSIWSGYVSKQTSSTYFNLASGTWIQPTIGSTACSGSTFLGWVGIGGYGSSKLLQDGTNQSNQAWFEYLGPNNTGVSITLLPQSLNIHAGDTIEAITEYANGTAYWTVEDATTGLSSSASLSHASSYYDGSSTEWIDERTTFSNGPSPLANYGVADWTNATAEITSSGYKDALSSLTNVTQLTMVNPNTGHTLALPLNEGVNGYTFQTDWKNCS